MSIQVPASAVQAVARRDGGNSRCAARYLQHLLRPERGPSIGRDGREQEALARRFLRTPARSVTTFVYAVTTFVYEIVFVLLQKYLRGRGVLDGTVDSKLTEVKNRRRRAGEGKIPWKSSAGNDDYAPYPPVIIEEPCHQYRRTFSYL